MAIADKIKLISTKLLTAKNVDEVDELLVEMKQLFEENSRYSADVNIQWERVPGEDMTETHTIKFKSLQEFGKLVGAIRANEENFIDYVFSATIKLKLEKKDKEAERALKEKEMDFFQEMTAKDMLDKGEKLIDEAMELQNKIQFIEDNKKLIEDFMPDGKEIDKITFTHRQDGIEGEQWN